MSLNLTQPAAGTVGWDSTVNANFLNIQNAINTSWILIKSSTSSGQSSLDVTGLAGDSNYGFIVTYQFKTSASQSFYLIPKDGSGNALTTCSTLFINTNGSAVGAGSDASHWIIGSGTAANQDSSGIIFIPNAKANTSVVKRAAFGLGQADVFWFSLTNVSSEIATLNISTSTGTWNYLRYSVFALPQGV